MHTLSIDTSVSYMLRKGNKGIARLAEMRRRSLSSPPTMLVVASRHAYLPSRQGAPATIEVCSTTGRILAIHDEWRPRSHYPELSASDYIDTGAQWLLPGVRQAVICMDWI